MTTLPIPALALWKAFTQLSPMGFAFFLAAANDDGQAGAIVANPTDMMEAIKAAGWEPDVPDDAGK